MDELTHRICLLREGGVVSESGCRDLVTAVCLLAEKCSLDRDDERLVPFVTHLAAAIGRADDGEAVAQMSRSTLEEVQSSDLYPEIADVCDRLITAMENRLSDDERDYLIVHIGGLLTSLQTGEKGESQ